MQLLQNVSGHVCWFRESNRAGLGGGKGGGRNARSQASFALCKRPGKVPEMLFGTEWARHVSCWLTWHAADPTVSVADHLARERFGSSRYSQQSGPTGTTSSTLYLCCWISQLAGLWSHGFSRHFAHTQKASHNCLCSLILQKSYARQTNQRWQEALDGMNIGRERSSSIILKQIRFEKVSKLWGHNMTGED